MLHELRVENLLLIERAELGLGPGLNVLTGETGAGKTVLAHALDLLLGGKPRPGIVRPGASEAYVEGVFALPAALREELADRLPEEADELVLARRVSAEGRTRAYLGGRSATAADLAEIGGALLSFYGQHEHRRLTLASAQLEILDGFCGAVQAERREAFAAAYARERELREQLEELRARAGARDRELDLLDWELEEIDRAEPSETEEESLLAERERLRHLGALMGAAGTAVAAFAGDDDSSAGAAPALAAAASALEAIRGVDAELDALADRAQALAVEADDLAGELRRYGEGIEAAPGRLDEVEERLALLDRLKRKHGGTIAAVLAYAEECRRRRDELAGAEQALEAGEAQVEAARVELAKLAAGAAEGAPRGGRPAGRGGRRAAGRAGHGGRELRGERHRARRLRADRRRRGRFPDRSQPRRPGRPAARDCVRRRAVARDARADGRRRRGWARHARLRRGRRRHRRPDRPRRRRAAARSRGRPPGHLHHPPAPDRLARRPPLHDRQGHVVRHRHDHRDPAASAATWWASWCGCSAPRTATPPPAATPASC